MTEHATTEVTLRDLRVIIHGLRLEGFAYVEEQALTDIQQMIKGLPSPETLNAMVNNPGDIRNLQNNIGKIMRIIELYGKKGLEYKTRYKARTKLPPRYRVFDWSVDMNMDKAARDFAREMIKTSSKADSTGHSKVASDLIVCAKMVQKKEAKEQDIQRVISGLREAGLNEEADFIKEAAPQWMKNMWQGVKDVGQQVGQGVQQKVQDVTQKVQDVGRGVKETYQAGKYRSALEGIMGQINQVLQGVQADAQVAQGPKKQELSDISIKLDNMRTVGQEVFELVMEDEQQQASGDWNVDVIERNPPAVGEGTEEEVGALEGAEVGSGKAPQQVTQDAPQSQFTPQPNSPATYTNQQGTQSQVMVVERLPNGNYKVKGPQGREFAVQPGQLSGAPVASVAKAKFNLRKYNHK